MSEDENREQEHTRPAPYDDDAERALLGAAILSTAARSILVAETRPEDFYGPKNRLVAEALIQAFEEGIEVDPITLADVLDRRGKLWEAGGPGELIDLQSATPATSSASRYATIVHDHATLRRLISSAEQISKLGYGRGDAHEAVVAARELLEHVAANNGSRTYSTLDIPDLAPYVAGTIQLEQPELLTRTDGHGLLYAGKMHVFQAEPSTGKTWLALEAVKEILDVGGAAFYLDWEDSARGILGRLLALGADPAAVAERFQYAQPVGAFTAAERTVVEGILARLNPDLIVLDGVAEALARDGLSEDKAADVVAWGEKLPRWLSRTGAAVLMLDHVVKSKEDQGRWARGSGAKLGMIDGAAYSLRTSGGFSRKKAGGMRVVIAKDRPGGVGSIGDTAAMISIEPHADGTRVLMKVEPDNAAKRITDPFRPTGLMAKVSAEVEQASTPLTARALRSLIHSDKPKFVSEAIARLVAEGYLREVRQGSTIYFRHVKPYNGEATYDHELEEPPELFGEEPDLPPTGTAGPGVSDYSEEF